jgi:hypothetical protein
MAGEAQMGGQAQLPLPGDMAPRRPTGPPRRRRSHARVWSDPAVLQATGEASHRFEEWRASLAGWMHRLPAERRAELRERLFARRPPAQQLGRAA